MNEVVYLIFGTDPQETISPGVQRKMIEVVKAQNEADSYMLRGLLTAFAAHCETATPGGQLSVMVNLGKLPDDDNPNPICSTASFVVNDPSGHRHVWEFDVERRKAAKP